MSRTQIQQVIVVILLIVFGVVWQLSQKHPGIPAATQGSSSILQQSPPDLSPPPDSNEPSAPLELTRDIFLPPASLQEKIQREEEEKQRKILEEQQRLQQLQTGTPAAAPPIDLSQFHLQGIFWGTARPQAIINRKIVSVGDRLEGAEVSSITKEKVLLNIQGANFELKLPGMRTSTTGTDDGTR